MPITTPKAFLARYVDKEKHFTHVLNALFVPGVEKAGYKAILPTAGGSENIHYAIIQNLEKSDMVLCDMSCLNPNVFFEFGIRAALNKPVCIVKDRLVGKPPFDTGSLHYKEYNETLGAWESDAQIKMIADHLRETKEKSNGENALWKHFGMQTNAQAYAGDTGPDAKIDYLTMQVTSVQEQLDRVLRSNHIALEADSTARQLNTMHENTLCIMASGENKRLEEFARSLNSLQDITWIQIPPKQDDGHLKIHVGLWKNAPKSHLAITRAAMDCNIEIQGIFPGDDLSEPREGPWSQSP